MVKKSSDTYFSSEAYSAILQKYCNMLSKVWHRGIIGRIPAGSPCNYLTGSLYKIK